MILIKSQGPVRPIKIKYMTEEGIKVSARPILVFTCSSCNLFLILAQTHEIAHGLGRFSKLWSA